MGVFALAITLSLGLARANKVLGIPALLLTGVALGPDMLGLLHDRRFLDGAGDIGLVLLLFYTALFAHPRALREGGRIALPLAAYDLVLNFAAAYWIGELFGWDVQSRLLLAGVMATSSTGAILKILSDEGRLLRREGNVLVALLWFEDLAFIGYYLFLNTRFGLHPDVFSWDTVLGLVLFVGYLILLGLARETVWLVRQREILVPLITGLGLLGTYLGSLGGVPLVGSAFTTGLVLAGSRGATFVQREAPYLREVAAAIFFLSFGALLNPGVTLGMLPFAAAALGGILATELLFLPQAARVLGLTGLESHILGSSLIARGGKSAAFARLGSDASGPSGSYAAQVQSVSGVLTVLLTPLAPLLVRLVLWLRVRSEDPARSLRSVDVVSRITRRVLAPAEYAQRNTVHWTARFVLVEWFLLIFLLGVLASLVTFPTRWGPLIAGGVLLVPAYQEARRYFALIPGTPGTTFASRDLKLPRLEAYLPVVLIIPFLLMLVLPLLAPLALVAFPAAGGVCLIALLLLPRLVHPRARVAPRLRRVFPPPERNRGWPGLH